MSGYQLGIDLGTTRSATAVCRSGADRAEPAGPAVATVVYAGADGSFLIGDEARARALAHPARVVDGFVRRVGDPTPVLLGREPVAAEGLVARFVSRLAEQVTAREGAGPAGMALAYPTGWGRHRVDSLGAALGGRAAMVPQAVAAVLGHARDLEPGALVAVHDLGGASFDAAVVRVVPGGAELVAPGEGLERFGGDDIDEAVFAHVRAGLGQVWTELDGGDPRVREAVARLRRDCTLAKERLSADTEVVVPVRLPGRAQLQVRLARAELEETIRGPVSQTVDTLARALETAEVAPADLADVLLVGGSARIPLVAQLVSAGLGRAVTVAADPKGVFAEGAARWSARRAGGAVAGGGAVRAAGATPVRAAGAGAVAAVVTGAGGAAGAAGAGGPGGHGAASAAVSLAPGDSQPIRPVVPRPPKQARAFPTEAAAESRLPLFIGVGLLVLTILGALVAVGASRYAAENSAVATTPTAVTPAGQQGAAPSPRAVAPSPVTPTRRPPATAPPVATSAPTTTTVPPTTAGQPPPDDADGQGDQGGGGNGGGNGGGGDGAGDGGGAGTPDAGEGGGQDAGAQGAAGQAPVGQGTASSTTPTPAP